MGDKWRVPRSGEPITTNALLVLDGDDAIANHGVAPTSGVERRIGEAPRFGDWPARRMLAQNALKSSSSSAGKACGQAGHMAVTRHERHARAECVCAQHGKASNKYSQARWWRLTCSTAQVTQRGSHRDAVQQLGGEAAS